MVWCSLLDKYSLSGKSYSHLLEKFARQEFGRAGRRLFDHLHLKNKSGIGGNLPPGDAAIAQVGGNSQKRF